MTSKASKPAYGGRTGSGLVMAVAQQDTWEDTLLTQSRQAARIASQCRVTPAHARAIAALHFGEVRL